MKIYDINNNIVENPDLELGRLIKDSLFIAHHNAIEPVEEQWHYETVREYSNGGKDVKRVVDVVGIKAQESWDEYEDIYRYILYTEEELAEINAKKEDTIESLLLEMAANHEYRLCLLELGVSENDL